jgi:uncharacterized protein (TIGR02246 family)
MKLLKSLCIIALLSMTFLACQPASAPEQKASAPPDPAPVNAVRDQYMSMYNSGDVSGIGDLYTDDAVVMNNNQEAMKGKQAIQQAAEAMVQMFTVNIAITPADTQIVGDLAYEYGSYELSMTPKAGGNAVQNGGNYLVILKHGADGSWKLTREIGNSNKPMAMP